MTTESFENLITEAVERLPQSVREQISNVAFLVEDKVREKKSDELGIMMGESLLGLYEGIANTERGGNYGNVLPDRVTIFKEPICQVCGNDFEKIKELVYEVVWHEIGHYFGFDEEGIRKREEEKFHSSKFRHG